VAYTSEWGLLGTSESSDAVLNVQSPDESDWPLQQRDPFRLNSQNDHLPGTPSASSVADFPTSPSEPRPLVTY